MPELFKLTDIGMTIDVLNNISEVMRAEIKRRDIYTLTVSMESGIPEIWLQSILHSNGKNISVGTTLIALEWLVMSMCKSAGRPTESESDNG